MIGDKMLDVETGINAGIGTAMVMTGYGREHAARLTADADVMGEDLLDAVKKIIGLISEPVRKVS